MQTDANKITVWAVTGRYDPLLADAMNVLDQAGLLAGAQLFVPSFLRDTFERTLPRRARVRTPPVAVQCGHLLHFALSLTTLKCEAGQSRCLLVGEQRPMPLLSHHLDREMGDRVRSVSRLDRTVLASLLAEDPGCLDRAAINAMARIAAEGRTWQPLSRWADLLFEQFPTLKDGPTRRILIGHRQVAWYARSLGFRVDSAGRVCTTDPGQPRPRHSDLIAVYDALRGTHPACRFPEWCAQLQEAFPALRDEKIRRHLFGERRMEAIAALAGLSRQGQWLHALPATNQTRQTR